MMNAPVKYKAPPIASQGIKRFDIGNSFQELDISIVLPV